MALAIGLVLAVFPTVGQSQSTAEADTGTALTADMELLDRRLLATTREPLERWGNTFRAIAMYVPDTAGPPQAFEIGLEHPLDTRQPGVHRDTLRSIMRRRQKYEPARTIGIIVDSIAGPVEEALDGADGPDFARRAITELEDRSGRCRRVERDYRFAREPRGDWGFGTVVFGPPRTTRCDPVGYWPKDSSNAEPVGPTRPRLAAPIVRPLDISSLGVQFTVVGEFKGKLTVFDDSIVVRFDRLTAARQLPNDTRTVKLDSIRVGVGVGDQESWSPVDDSKALRIRRVLPPGGKILRRNVRFVMRHERSEEDVNSWIVVTFHITVAHPGDPNYLPQATTYAHSVKGVLAETAPKDQPAK